MSGLITPSRELNTYGQIKVGSSNAVEMYTGDKLVFPVLKPLEYYTGSVAAYSLRQLTGSAAYAIKVRRDSDNTTQDIGFDASGSLHTASLLSFVGAGTGYVDTWYDQSEYSNHLISPFGDSSREPVIVSSGTLITTNSKPAVSFNGVNQALICTSGASYYVSATGLFFTFGVGKQNTTSGTHLMAHIDNNSTYRTGQLIRTDSSDLTAIAFNTSNDASQDTGPSVGTNQFISYTNRTLTTIEIYGNGSSNGATSATNPQVLSGGATTQFTLGGFNLNVNNYMWNGTMQEVIHFNLSSTQYTNYAKGLTARIRAYYNTY